jgi:hypothetical protein
MLAVEFGKLPTLINVDIKIVRHFLEALIFCVKLESFYSWGFETLNPYGYYS